MDAHDYDEFVARVNADLGSESEGAAPIDPELVAAPHRWVAVLIGIRDNVRGQIRDRNAELNALLAYPEPDPNFHEVAKRHRAWRRKAQRFLDRVCTRIGYVRGLVPDNDLRELLVRGAALDPESPDLIRAWQDQVKRLCYTE